MIKISVIVPTFNNTKENMDRLIKSFDNQTMNSDEYEIIFVDDGSSDFQSFKRLKEIEQERENYIVKGISPSGWGSKPRNMGTQIAKGEYVFYCDDDDTIFPQALERMYNFADSNNLDIVNPKVIRTKGWSWGWNEYKENVIGAEKLGIQSMGPMTVPKLYKKSFLETHNLSFSEGNKVWWEDIMFSCLVYSKRPHIGILADYPIYHWREQNRSAGFGKDVEYKWSQIYNVADFFVENLTGLDQITMLKHWYQSRVLGSIRNKLHSKADSVRKTEFKNANKFREKFITDEIIGLLSTKDKILDFTLKEDRLDLASKISESRSNITARSYLKNVSFIENKIVISCSANLTENERSDIKFEKKFSKVKVNLPSDILKEIPKELRYFTEEEINESVYLPAIKGRYSRATWDIKSIQSSKINYHNKLINFAVSSDLTFSIDLDDYSFDKEDYYQPWDIATRFSFLDNFAQRGIACKKDFKKAAIINNNTYVIYKNNSELLSIDMNSTILDFFAIAKLEIENYQILNEDEIIIPISNVYTYGNTNINYIASIINEVAIGFVDTIASISANNGEAYLKLPYSLFKKGNNRVTLALNNKTHQFEINI